MSGSYNEVFHSSGAIRQQYEKSWTLFSRLKHSEIASMKTAMQAVFSNDAPVLPFPRILTHDEYQHIAAGVLQRGLALRNFLLDHYFGAKKYVATDLIPAATLQRILARNHEMNASSILRPENLQFWYAPDIIRDPLGNFRVLEDNLGFVGGMGDFAASQLAARYLSLPAKLKNDQTKSDLFYQRLAQNALKQAKHYGPGETIMISYHRQLCDTFEDVRLEAILSQYGIKTIRTPFAGKPAPGGHFLVARDSQLFLQRRFRNVLKMETPVSFVILNIDQADIEPTHPVTQPRFKAQRVPGLDRVGTPGFWNAVKLGNVGVFNPPGFEFVNDKEFYLYVDQLIPFYLNERPLLPSIETMSFLPSSKNQHALQQLFESPNIQLAEWVIKGVGGKCGDQVWLGPRLSPVEFKKLQRAISRNPSAYIAQKFIPLSTLMDHYVDLRVHGVISQNESFVSDTPWGRASPTTGNGKVNISNNGSLSLVVVEPARKTAI